MTDELAWTSEPLPDGAQILVMSCQTCHAERLTVEKSGFVEPISRTVEPVGERYLVMPHHRWCPIVCGADQVNGCPQCGAAIKGLDFSPGYTLAVPEPLLGGGVGHLVGPAEEILSDLRVALAEGPPERAQSHDEAKLSPCGHLFRGDDAHEARRRFGVVVEQREQARAEEVLAADAQLLAAAEKAGYSKLVLAYRQAVRGHRGTVSGLRVALHVLTEPDGT